jgi:hypothetical protein
MRLTSLVSSLLVLSTLLCVAQTSEQTSSSGRITGIVLSEDGQPIVHAYACVSSAELSTTECNVFTDQGGQFEVQSLPMGIFFVYATKEEDGYSALNQARRRQRVILTPQDPMANVTIRLAPKSGILIGTVRDRLTGRPVERVNVVYVSTDAGYTGSAGQYTGEFRVNLPTTADFIVIVSAPGYKHWFYTDPDDQSRPSLHLASGEQKSLNVELVRESTPVDKP